MIPDEASFNEECSIERNPPELKRWADECMARLASTEEGKSAIRMRRGVAKKFIEEVYPLSRWAVRFCDPNRDIRCRYVLGDQAFDAVIIDHASEPPTEAFLEITQAMEGYDDHLRMEFLEKHEYVPMIAKPKRSGTRANREISVQFEAANHSTLIGQTCKQVREALERKSTKKYGPLTSLLVMLEDVYFEWECDFGDIERLLLDWLRTHSSPFIAVYLLGWQGRVAVASFSDPASGWTLRQRSQRLT